MYARRHIRTSPTSTAQTEQSPERIQFDLADISYGCRLVEFTCGLHGSITPEGGYAFLFKMYRGVYL